MTARGVQTGNCGGAAGEIGRMAGLAGAEAGHVRDVWRQLCRRAVGGRGVPTGWMAELTVAERIVETSGRPGRGIRRRGKRRHVGAASMAIRANCRIPRIGRGMGPCRRRRSDPRCGWMGRVHTMAGETGCIHGPAGEIGSVAGLARAESACLRFCRCAVLVRVGPARGMTLTVAECIIKASRCSTCRSRRYQRNGRVCSVGMTDRADRRIALVGVLVHSRPAPPCRGMGRVHTMTGKTGNIRDAAREIVLVAGLAICKTAFGVGFLCPGAMRIRVRPSGYVLAGLGVQSGRGVLVAASRERDEKPEEQNDGSMYFSYLRHTRHLALF